MSQQIRLLQPANEQPQTDRPEMLFRAGLELSRKALDIGSLEELYFLLTNDMRAVVEFDCSYLLTHLGGISRVVAIGNQPILDKKSKYYDPLNSLGAKLVHLEKPILLSKTGDLEKLTPDVLDPEIKKGVLNFLEFSGAGGIFIVPLRSGDEIIAHLVYEFLENRMPDQVSVLTFVNISTFLGGALAKSWALSKNPAIIPLTKTTSRIKQWLPEQTFPRLKLALAIFGMILVFLFIIPVPFNVGGEAEVVPRYRHTAFCQTEGIIDKILTTEGAKVQKGQVIANLDSTEPLHKITIAKRQIELLKNEMQLLRRSASENVSKLAESQLTNWKLKKAEAELDFLNWQLRFLEITAPVTGIVVTKQIEALVGKKFRPGEPFCEIADPGDLCTEIFVPEDRTAFVEIGQKASLSLNSDPMGGFALKVTEIAPRAEVLPHLGNVYRVRAVFTENHPKFSVGQKGTGSISVGTRNVWFIGSQRIGVRMNELSHYLW